MVTTRRQQQAALDEPAGEWGYRKQLPGLLAHACMTSSLKLYRMRYMRCLLFCFVLSFRHFSWGRCHRPLGQEIVGTNFPFTRALAGGVGHHCTRLDLWSHGAESNHVAVLDPCYSWPWRPSICVRCYNTGNISAGNLHIIDIEIDIHKYTHTRTHTHTYTHTHMHIHMYVYTYAYTYVCIHVYT